MASFSVALVGMHFRPPAKALLAVLPGGATLLLEREPDNPYDPNAVKVSVAVAEIPKVMHDDLAMALPQWGKSLEEVMAQPVWHLGYVDSKKTGMARVVSEHMTPEGVVTSARLAFDHKGDPCVNIEIKVG